VIPILNLWDGHPDALHLMVEAMRIAYADRLSIWEIQILSKYQQLTSRAYAAKGDKEIRMDKHKNQLK